MRRQHHLVPRGGGRFDAWDVRRLVPLARGLPVLEWPLAWLSEIDEPAWTDGAAPRLGEVAAHMRLVQAVDPRHPIPLTAQGRILDGRHRVVRALLEGRTTIPAVRFDPTPEPDARDVTLAALGYA